MARIQSIEALEAANRRERATDKAALWLAIAEATERPSGRRVHRKAIAPASALEAPAPSGPSVFLGPREGVWTRAGRRPSVIRVEAAIKAAREIIARTGGASVGRRYSPMIALERLLALAPDDLAYFTEATFDGWTHDAWRGYRGGAPAPSDCYVGAEGWEYNLSANVRERASRGRSAAAARRRATRAVAALTPEQVERQRALWRARDARRRERAGAAYREQDAARKRESRAGAAIKGTEAGRE